MKLSPLAQELFAKLNKFSKCGDIGLAALSLYEDQSLPKKTRLAYYEVYEYCLNNY